jgi:NAD(P)-dependent dehydrogenase (short-subunit alcohol dehydrogenase family)
MKLADKVVVVTGAGSGIGREVVLEALRRGAALAAVDVNPTTLDETASLAAAGARLSTHVVNLLYRVNPSGAAAFIARQMKGLLGR